MISSTFSIYRKGKEWWARQGKYTEFKRTDREVGKGEENQKRRGREEEKMNENHEISQSSLTWDKWAKWLRDNNLWTFRFYMADRSVHTDWALLQTCERASILGCFSAWLTLSTESTSSSLSSFGSLFQWCFLSEASSYPLFKMALPLSLSLTCFLHASPLDKLYISLFIILMVSSLPLEYKLSESRLLPILASVISKLPTTTLCKKQLNKCYWTNDWILISLRLM